MQPAGESFLHVDRTLAEQFCCFGEGQDVYRERKKIKKNVGWERIAFQEIRLNPFTDQYLKTTFITANILSKIMNMGQ